MSHLSLEESESQLLETINPALPENSITVLVVDDHALVRATINQLLILQPEIKRVIVVQNYLEAETQAASIEPDIIWLDMQVVHSPCNGITEIHRLRKFSPKSRIMAFADVENGQEALAAILAGAQGYCSKQDVNPSDIITMIHMIYRGEIALRPELLTSIMQRIRSVAMPTWGFEKASNDHVLLRGSEKKELDLLTIREREILHLISQGHRDRDIANGLNISERTV
jgi:DNA-binding NarL/FixJ family response regulator